MTGGSGGLVPAEAESAPDGTRMGTQYPRELVEGMDGEAKGSDKGGVGVVVGSAGRNGGKMGAKSSREGSRRSKRSSRSSARVKGRRERGDGGGMRPAMPFAAPTDEMRPSPGPDPSPPRGPWMT